MHARQVAAKKDPRHAPNGKAIQSLHAGAQQAGRAVVRDARSLIVNRLPACQRASSQLVGPPRDRVRAAASSPHAWLDSAQSGACDLLGPPKVQKTTTEGVRATFKQLHGRAGGALSLTSRGPAAHLKSQLPRPPSFLLIIFPLPKSLPHDYCATTHSRPGAATLSDIIKPL